MSVIEKSFTKTVSCIVNILCMLSEGDHPSRKAINQANQVLSDIESITNDEKYLIAQAALQVFEGLNKPLVGFDPFHRGHVIRGSIRIDVVDIASGECYG